MPTRSIRFTDRRRVLGGLAWAGAAGLAAGAGIGRIGRAAASDAPLTGTIPSTGAAVPVIGMGTWITFNVGADTRLRDARTEVLQAFLEEGGGMVDSSPMYGSAEEVLGYGLQRVRQAERLFSATKVWTRMQGTAESQMADSRRLWGIESFDLMQVHNLVDWESHLETLREAKDAGRVRHIGITTSHGARHQEMERIMRSEPLDFVQLTYNIADREAEARLLPLARERGIAVIANRPFRRKQLISRFEGEPLPDWAAEIGCFNWPQFLLKFIVSHPAVLCAIPATSQVDHVRENMGAARGPMPDREIRERMIRYVESL